MKRSEMELFIEQIIIEHHGYKDTNCSLANNILTAIEKAGMLPPEVNPIPKHIIDNCESANYWELEE